MANHGPNAIRFKLNYRRFETGQVVDTFDHGVALVYVERGLAEWVSPPASPGSAADAAAQVKPAARPAPRAKIRA